MTPGVTVVVPVGPLAHHVERLWDCLASVHAQAQQPEWILLIDDMHGLPGESIPFPPDPRLQLLTSGLYEGCLIWRSPWRLGVPGAFNMGVALAPTQLVFMLGSDDELVPQTLHWCVIEYLAVRTKHPGREDETYFWVDVEYTDTGEKQALPCNAAMVSKSLWALNGGFAPETGSGACDAALLSVMLARHDGSAGYLHHVRSPWPLYRYHRTSTSDTAGRSSWQAVILETRDILTRDWQRPRWRALPT